MSSNAIESVLAELESEALGLGEHQSPGVLIDYQARKLSEEADLRVAEHLTFCAECAGVVLDLEAGPQLQLADQGQVRSAAEEEDDWQAISRRLGGMSEAPAAEPDSAPPSQKEPPAPIPFKPRERKGFIPPSSLGLLAAVLALAVVGLAWQVASLSQRLNAPQANVFVADLEPISDGATRGAAKMEVPAGMEMVVFLLVQSDLRPFAGYAAELIGHQGEVLWQSQGLVPAKEGGFSLAVPLARLPGGEIEIRLYGLEGSKRERIATYRAHLGRAGKPASPAG